MNLILFAIPVFLLFIAVEWLWSRSTDSPIFKFRDSATNLACGMGSQVFGLLLAVIPLTAYLLIYDHARIYTFEPTSAVTWIVAIIGVDFCYYWFHRFSHVVNGLWIFHVVHHQSEEYNLTVALRQSWFGTVVAWIFYAPLAVIGIPFEIYAASYALNLLYQFFVHTRAVNRLGPLEWVLNTPSHHRVHHGRDREYLDRNYAGALIIWDRMFGTFVNEGKQPTYGVLKGFPEQSAIAANVNPIAGLLRTIKAFGWRTAFKHPGWQPGDNDPTDAVRRALADPHQTYSFSTWSRHDTVAFSLTVAAVGGTILFMAIAPKAEWGVRWGLAAALIAVFWGLAWLFRPRSSEPQQLSSAAPPESDRLRL